MNKDAIFCSSTYGPCFCGTSSFNIKIGCNNFLKEKCNTSKAKDNSYDINEDYELNNSKYHFFIKNRKVFKLRNY